MAKTYVGRSIVSTARGDLDLLWKRISAVAYPGDADKALDPALDSPVQVYATQLTANRNVFPPAGAQPNARFRIVHNTNVNDPFVVQVYAGPNNLTTLLAALDYNEWCEIENDGAGFVLTALGRLSATGSDVRFTEINDTRITEDGDLRVTES